MRVHGLIKSVGKTYKYYLTKLGKEVVLQAIKIKELVLIPAFNYLYCAKKYNNLRSKELNAKLIEDISRLNPKVKIKYTDWTGVASYIEQYSDIRG